MQSIVPCISCGYDELGTLNQFKYKALQRKFGVRIQGWRLYGTIGLSSAGLILNSAVAWACLPKPLPYDAQTDFKQWCEKRHSVDPTAQATIETLLKSIGTQDCSHAQKRLQNIHILVSFQTLANEPKPRNRLAIDAGEAFDLAPVVAAMPNLRHLNLVNTRISNLGAIQHLQQLNTLYLVGTQITDVQPIGSLKNLGYLDLSDNSIQDIAALSSLVNLTSLRLERNQIEDISTLSSLQELMTLEVSGNRIRDFSVLATLPKLYLVSLRDNPIDISTCSGKWADACEPDSTGR
jgi:internalin A